MTQKHGRALIVGASIAGLLAGRVLSESFDEVVLVDKESLDTDAGPRKAVPQGNHIHGILSPTVETLQRFMPEVIHDLEANGAQLFDAGADVRFLIHGDALTSGTTGQPMIGCTRPFFEHFLRKHVARVDNIDIRTDRRLVDWILTPDNAAVVGATIKGDVDEQLGADLVIDARGRASTLGKDLDELGYGKPPEDLVGVDLGYTSRLFSAPGFDPGWNLLLLNPYAPDVRIGGVIERVENEHWIVTQFGYFGDHAPDDDERFHEYAKRHYAPDIDEFLAVATPVSDFHRYGTKICRMVRFEKMKAFPERLIAIGDAVCNLNPVYGQGMTKAANEARYLHDALSSHVNKNDSLDGFSARVRKELPNVGAEWAWALTTGADLGYQATTGKRSPEGPFMGWYMKRLFTRAFDDLDTRAGIFNATMLVKPPQSLLAPRMMLRAMGF